MNIKQQKTTKINELFTKTIKIDLENNSYSKAVYLYTVAHERMDKAKKTLFTSIFSFAVWVLIALIAAAACMFVIPPSNGFDYQLFFPLLFIGILYLVNAFITYLFFVYMYKSDFENLQIGFVYYLLFAGLFLPVLTGFAAILFSSTIRDLEQFCLENLDDILRDENPFGPANKTLVDIDKRTFRHLIKTGTLNESEHRRYK